MIIKKLPFIAILVFFVLSCSDRSIDDLNSSLPITEIVTYDNSVASIINSNCIVCHAAVPQNGAPMSLSTYDEVKDAVLSRGLNSRINNPSAPMPPTGLMPQANRDIILEWIDNGFLEN